MLFLQRAIQLLTSSLFKIGDFDVSISSIFQLIFVLLIVIIITRGIRNFLREKLLAKLGIDKGNREAISSILSYAIGILGFLIILQSLGFNIASLAVVAGGLGVGIGIGLQEITNNFISGTILLFDRHIKVDDYIEWQWLDATTVKGTVKEISLRSTIVRTEDGSDMILPNSFLVGNQILNWSYDTPKARIIIPVKVPTDRDPIVITEIILNSAYMESEILYDPSPKVNFLGFFDNYFNFELIAWIDKVQKQEVVKNFLNFAINYNLYQAQNLVDNNSLPQAKPLSLLNLLKKVTYFQNFSNLELWQLIEVGSRKRLKESEILFKEGDPGDAFYIILSGSVEVFVEKINKHLTTLNAENFFGELSLMLGIPRTATIKAMEDTVLFVIKNDGFEKLLREHPELYELIVKELGKHQEELTQRQQQLRELGLMDVEEDDKNPVNWVRKRLKNIFSL